MMPQGEPMASFMTMKGPPCYGYSFERYIRCYGRRVSLYLDKDSTYKTTRQLDVDELLRGEKDTAQFERACGELGIKVIYANFP